MWYYVVCHRVVHCYVPTPEADLTQQNTETHITYVYHTYTLTNINRVITIELASSGILNTWIGNGSVIYVYRKNIRVAPTWMAAVDSDVYDMNADPSGRVSGV